MARVAMYKLNKFRVHVFYPPSTRNYLAVHRTLAKYSVPQPAKHEPTKSAR